MEIKQKKFKDNVYMNENPFVEDANITIEYDNVRSTPNKPVKTVHKSGYEPGIAAFTIKIVGEKSVDYDLSPEKFSPKSLDNEIHFANESFKVKFSDSQFSIKEENKTLYVEIINCREYGFSY